MIRTALALLLVSSPVAAEPMVHVIDGDTFKLADMSIRLAGIDAPELDQTCERDGQTWACGEASRDALTHMLGYGELTCKARDFDQYGRVVASCTSGDLDLGGFLVSQGLAIPWDKQNDMTYLKESIAARNGERGMWAGEFTRPWDWRK